MLIRIVIYGGAIAYLGYGAIQHWMDQKSAEQESVASPQELSPFHMEGLDTKDYTLPDGSTMKVYEMTQEQADALMKNNTADTSTTAP